MTGFLDPRNSILSQGAGPFATKLKFESGLGALSKEFSKECMIDKL